MADVTDPTDPTKPGNPIEALLMQQADAAIRAGKDPKAVTEHLGVMARHLRANTQVRDQANAALAAGKDPLAVSQHVYQLASAGPSGNINLGDGPPVPPAASSAPSTAASALSGAAQGSTFGFADEILGGIGAANALLPKVLGGEGASLSDVPAVYRRDRDKVRNFDSAASEAHGNAHLAGAVAGGLLPIVASGGAGAATGEASLAKIAGQGAAYGAAQGIGAAKDLSDIPRDALVSGGLGALGATALHGAGKGISALANKSGLSDVIANQAGKLAEKVPAGGKLEELLRAVQASTGKAGGANQTITEGLANEGQTPEGVLAKLRSNVQASGEKPEILADYSPETLRTTKALTKAPVDARSKIVKIIQDRNTGTRGRVLADLGGGRVPQDVRPALEGMASARSASAAQLFPKAGSQVIDDPAVNEILSRPTFKALYADATRLAADEGKTLPTVTRALPASGDGLKMAPDVWEKFAHANGLTEEIPTTNVETIGYIERALKDRIQQGFNGTSGTGRNQAAVLQKAFGELRGRIADLSPEYDAAVTDFATRSKPIDAATLGLNLNKYTGPLSKSVPKQAMGAGVPLAAKATRSGIPGLEKAVENMAPNAQSMFRQGAKTQLTDITNAVPALESGSTNNVLRSVSAFKNSPSSSRIRALLADSPDAQSVFEQALGRERGMASTSAKLGGSDTAENLSDAEARKVTSVLSHLLHPVRGLRAAGATIDKASTARANSALGDRLSASGSQQLESVLAELLSAAKGATGKAKIGNAIRNTGATRLAGATSE